jgi:AcrR family transcriptional regulator
MNAEMPTEPGKAMDILQASARLFRQKGYAATSTRDIARAVGMQSGSIFYYFRTKEDILLAVMRESLHRITEAVLQARAAALEPIEQLQAMIAAHLHVLLEEGDDFSVIFFDEWKSLSEKGKTEIRTLRDHYETLWQEVLETLAKTHAVRANSRVCRLFLLGGLNATVYWYRRDGGLSVAEIAAEIGRLFVGAPH